MATGVKIVVATMELRTYRAIRCIRKRKRKFLGITITLEVAIIMKIREDIKLDFDDVLIVPRRTTVASRKEVALYREFKFFHSPKQWVGIPIIAANMYSTGSIKMAYSLSSLGCSVALHKHHENVGIKPLFKDMVDSVWFSTGMSDEDFNKTREMVKELRLSDVSPNICIDIANGYTDSFVKYCAKIRDLSPNSIILAGNVCSPEMTQELIVYGGVDICKIGLGSGSACLTRIQTGVGYPQLSAVLECSKVAHGLKSGDGRIGLICSDGGCKVSGDVCKAFGAGSDFVMLGGMLAGTDESNNGDNQDGYSTFYGMSSQQAQETHGNGVPTYAVAEGKTVRIKNKGSAKEVINGILGGLRSSCTYTGVNSLKDYAKSVEFINVRNTHNKVFE